MKHLFFSFYFLCLLSACQHKANYVAPNHPVCDTSFITPSYKTDIQPIFAAHCYSCHGASVTTGGGLDLETFSSLKQYLEYGFRGDGIYGSKLFHCMLHANLALPMPPTYQVDACFMNRLAKWLAQDGLPN
ncbi:MAG: hypothetical protein QM530_01405 [Phycisphaerales bacterium]|nr:hypothetical protein [Phycisphaerales bacterium]